MDKFTICDNCNNQFSAARSPLILSRCGHTYCKSCVDLRLLSNEEGKLCPECGEVTPPDMIKANKKVQKILEIQSQEQVTEEELNNKLELASVKSQVVNVPVKSIKSEMTDMSRVFCFKHQDKQIEYFCRICHQLVCPKCMFKDHNGHEFAQLDEVTSVVKQNIGDLQKLLFNTRRINDDNKMFVDHQTGEIERLKLQQVDNIEKGFGEVIARLEAKRDALKTEFVQKYDDEQQQFLIKSEMIQHNSVEIENIDQIYKELQGFIERNSDAKILTKINDISDFMNKSIEDLEKITRIKSLDRNQCQISPHLMPLSLNADKVFDIITRFNMVQSKPPEQNKQ